MSKIAELPLLLSITIVESAPLRDLIERDLFIVKFSVYVPAATCIIPPSVTASIAS